MCGIYLVFFILCKLFILCNKNDFFFIGMIVKESFLFIKLVYGFIWKLFIMCIINIWGNLVDKGIIYYYYLGLWILRILENLE